MVIALIACGANNLEIPCRFFKDMESGKEICDRIFGNIGVNGQKLHDGQIRYDVNLEKDDQHNVVSDTLFTGFYYGRSGPGPFFLREIPFNAKCVGFHVSTDTNFA